MNTSLKEKILKIFKDSEYDKYGGMSALSNFIKFYKESDGKNNIDRYILNTIKEACAEELVSMSWLIAGLSSNKIFIPGAFEMLEARVMQEYAKSKVNKTVIDCLERDLKIINKNK